MEIIIVKSKIKEVANCCNVGSDFVDALNEESHKIFRRAEARAEDNGRKTIQVKDVYLGEEKDLPMLVVKSKLKELTSMNVSGDLASALNHVVVSIIDEASLRAQANGRKTIGARDI